MLINDKLFSKFTMEEVDKFYPKLWKAGTSHVITIPSNLVEGLGLKEGDRLKVWLRKEDVKGVDAETEGEDDGSTNDTE